MTLKQTCQQLNVFLRARNAFRYELKQLNKNLARYDAKNTMPNIAHAETLQTCANAICDVNLILESLNNHTLTK